MSPIPPDLCLRLESQQPQAHYLHLMASYIVAKPCINETYVCSFVACSRPSILCRSRLGESCAGKSPGSLNQLFLCATIVTDMFCSVLLGLFLQVALGTLAEKGGDVRNTNWAADVVPPPEVLHCVLSIPSCRFFFLVAQLFELF